MFPFVTRTDNPIVGACKWDLDMPNCGTCGYCYAQGEKGIKHNRPVLKKLYTGEPRLNPNVLRKRLKSGDFLFPSMRDWYSLGVTEELRSKAFSWIRECSNVATARGGEPITVLILTKNPRGAYTDLTKDLIPRNCIIGATIEADINYTNLSGAPPQSERIEFMISIKSDFPEYKTFVCAEPILQHNEDFAELLAPIRPWAFAVGYDNHKHRMLEPALAITKKLVDDLSWTAPVYLKKLRKAWWEEE